MTLTPILDLLNQQSTSLEKMLDILEQEQKLLAKNNNAQQLITLVDEKKQTVEIILKTDQKLKKHPDAQHLTEPQLSDKVLSIQALFEKTKKQNQINAAIVDRASKVNTRLMQAILKTPAQDTYNDKGKMTSAHRSHSISA